MSAFSLLPPWFNIQFISYFLNNLLFLHPKFFMAVLSALYIVQARLVAPQLNYINVVRLRERHDYADLTLLALYMISQ